MARGGHRYGAGRPGWKAKAEQSFPLDVRRMHRAGVLWDGYWGRWQWTDSYTETVTGRINFAARRDGLTLSYTLDGQPCQQFVPLTHTRCHFGGIRPWFTCPVGGERVAVLYLNGGRFACRHCNQVAYLSQSEDLAGRASLKQSRLERRLGEDWQRPKGMHRTTYDRLLSRVWECEMVMDHMLFGRLERLGYLER